MNFNMIILISFVFVVIPALIKRFELENKIDARIQKVLDINFIFDTALGRFQNINTIFTFQYDRNLRNSIHVFVS